MVRYVHKIGDNWGRRISWRDLGGRGSEVRSKKDRVERQMGLGTGKNIWGQVPTAEDRVRTDAYSGRTDVDMSRVV